MVILKKVKVIFKKVYVIFHNFFFVINYALCQDILKFVLANLKIKIQTLISQITLDLTNQRMKKKLLIFRFVMTFLKKTSF